MKKRLIMVMEVFFIIMLLGAPFYFVNRSDFDVWYQTVDNTFFNPAMILIAYIIFIIISIIDMISSIIESKNERIIRKIWKGYFIFVATGWMLLNAYFLNLYQ